MLAAQQHVQQHAQRVDVGRRRDRPAGELLGRGVLGRERPPPVALSAGSSRAPSSSSSLAMPKSSSLTPPSASHEHVRRLEVAVDDQVRVGVRDRLEHVEEQAEARLDRQRSARRSTWSMCSPST